MHSDMPADAKPAPSDTWLGKLGPGLITGAADDDPSGIISRRLRALGWLCTVVMAVAVLAMFATMAARYWHARLAPGCRHRRFAYS